MTEFWRKVRSGTLVLAGLAVSCGAIPNSTLSGVAAPKEEARPSMIVAPRRPAELMVVAPEVVLGPGEVLSLAKVVLLGDGTRPSGLRWSSGAPAVASVDPRTGLLTARTPGFAEITAWLDVNRQATILVEVSNRHTISKVEIDPPALALNPGERRQLTARVEMADGTLSGQVIWSSSDYNLASVDPTTGEVTALRPGEVTIKGAAIANVRRFGLTNVLVRRAGEAIIAPGAWSEGAVAPGAWSEAPSGVRSTIMHLVSAPGGAVWAVGSPGTLLRSSDDGATWEDMTPSALRGRSFRRLAMVAATHGFLAADNELFETTDGGVEWRSKLRGRTPFQELAFWPDGEGVLTDGSATFLKTADGGATWAPSKVPGVPAVSEVRRAGGGRWLLGGNGVYAQREGGWKKLSLPEADRRRLFGRQIDLVDAAQAWYVSGTGRLYKTIDGGDRWYEHRIFSETPLQAPAASGVFAVRFHDATRGGLVRGSQYLETRDGAQSWKASTFVPTHGAVWDVAWGPAGQAWLFGPDGLLMRKVAR